MPQLLGFLLACSTCSCVHPPLDHKTKTGPQRDIPSAIKVGKMRWRGWQRILSPRRVSLSSLSPTPPRHRQLNICLLKSHFPPLHSKPPFLFIAEVCRRTEIKASGDLQEGLSVSQHLRQRLWTQTRTRTSRLAGWPASSPRSCLPDWRIGQLTSTHFSPT